MSRFQDMALIAARFTPALDTPFCHESNAPQILSIVGVFFGLAMLTVLLRIYVRTIMLSVFGPDDWVMLAAALMALGTFICFVGETNYGVGRHVDCIQIPELEIMMKWQFYHNLWVMFGVVFVKISVALFLIRLAPKTSWKWFLGGCIVFLVCFVLACAGTLIFSCIPVAASWNLKLAATAKCFSPHVFSSIGLMNSVINIFTDFLFALLPIPIIYKLQINRRTKISLALILSLGFVACAAGIVKAHLQTTFLLNPDRYWDDGFMVWNMIELCLGIMAASLPSLRPLFNTFFQSAKNTLGLSGSRSKSNGFGYKKQGNSREADDLFHVHNVEFKEMKSPRSTMMSKNDIEVTREVEIDTMPIRGADAGRYDDRDWR